MNVKVKGLKKELGYKLFIVFGNNNIVPRRKNYVEIEQLSLEIELIMMA